MKYLIAIGLSLWICSVFAQSDIVAAEIFFDSDPGIGAGTSIGGILPSGNIDLSLSGDISGLGLGPHLMGLRILDENGLWSMTHHARILVVSSDPLIVNAVTEVEYYFDTDPGQGAGIQIPVTAGFTLDLNNVIDASGLAPGMHNLYVRVKNDRDEWSIVESTILFIRADDPFTIADIVQVEYFFDNDPGIGNGIDIPLTNTSTIDLSLSLDVSALNPGNHSFNLRVLSSSGEWSTVQSARFYIDQPIAVTTLEYFVDNDPGPGSGTILSVTPVADSIELDLLIPTASLPIGPHTMNARIGQNTKWGITESAPFTLCDGATAQISADRVCEGEPTTFVDLSTNVQAGDLYSWDFDGDSLEDSNAGGDQVYSFSNPGVYSTTLTIDRSGCPGIVSITTTVDTLVTLSGNVPGNIEFGNSGTLSGSTSGTVQSVQWATSGSGTFTDPTSLSTTYSPSIQDGLSGAVDLTLSAIHSGTCTIQDAIFAVGINLPADLEITVYNAVSPNDDGKHDFLEIENIEAYPNNSVVIFNRWGDLIEKIDGYNNSAKAFKGFRQDKPIPSGTYYYEINLGNGSDLIKGFLMLVQEL